MAQIDDKPVREFKDARRTEFDSAQKTLSASLENAANLPTEEQEEEVMDAWGAFWATSSDILESALSLCTRLIGTGVDLLNSVNASFESNFAKMKALANMGATQTALELLNANQQSRTDAEVVAEQLRITGCAVYEDMVRMVVRFIGDHATEIKTYPAVDWYGKLCMFIYLIKTNAEKLSLPDSFKKEQLRAYRNVAQDLLGAMSTGYWSEHTGEQKRIKAEIHDAKIRLKGQKEKLKQISADYDRIEKKYHSSEAGRVSAKRKRLADLEKQLGNAGAFQLQKKREIKAQIRPLEKEIRMQGAATREEENDFQSKLRWLNDQKELIQKKIEDIEAEKDRHADELRCPPGYTISDLEERAIQTMMSLS